MNANMYPPSIAPFAPPLVSLLDYAVPCMCPTATAQQKGAFILNGNIRFFTKKRIAEAANDWAGILRPARERFGMALGCGVAVSAVMIWPYLKSTPKRDSGKLLPLERRPDLDNLCKALLDVASKLQFWLDDALAWGVAAFKFRGPVPQFRLTVAVVAGSKDARRTPIALDLTGGPVASVPYGAAGRTAGTPDNGQLRLDMGGAA